MVIRCTGETALSSGPGAYSRSSVASTTMLNRLLPMMLPTARSRSPRQVAIIREVALQQGPLTVVFARSVLPISSLTGRLAHLRRLRNRPLGAILFSHPGMRRTPFELALIQGHSNYLPGALHQGTPAWGRRSCFDLGGKRLMVSEVFLQGFRPWPAVMPVHRTQRGRVTTANSEQPK